MVDRVKLRSPTPRSEQPRAKRDVGAAALNFELPDLDEEMDASLDAISRVTAKRGKGVDKRGLEELEAFRKTFTRLKEQAGGEAEDFRSDTSAKVMYRSMLAAVVEMIPTAMEKYLTEKNESAAYAFNALVNQAKDLQTALRNLESLEEQSDYIVMKILMPTFVRFTQNLLSGLMLTKSELDTMGFRDGPVNKLREKLDDMVREHVKFIEESSKTVGERISGYLIGDEQPGAKKKKGK